MNATLGDILTPVSGLYFMLYASVDFTTWWQVRLSCTRPAPPPPLPPPRARPVQLPPTRLPVPHTSMLISDSQANDVDVTSQFQLVQTEEEGEEQRTIPQVQTYGCLGEPGFVYLVGCVHEGMPQTKRSSTSVKPPFKDCIAINSICGASCMSGAYEPTIYNPSRPDMWGQQKDTHCVTPDSQVERDGFHHWGHHHRTAVGQGEQVR